jgi:hypothetical protein
MLVRPLEVSMPRHAQLNNLQHKDLRVITRRSTELGDGVGSVVVFPTEFREAQREYPILFRKEPGTEDFLAAALFGFAKDENLFLDANGWNARYIPAVVARGPFLIGFQEDSPVVHIDLDHPRISETEGEPLFLPLGGQSPYLQHIASVLDTIHRGLTAAKQMSAAFTALDLVTPINLEVRLTADEHHQLHGYYAIDEERFRALDAPALSGLHQAGFLESAYFVMASLKNLQRLVDRKVARNRAAGGGPGG